MDIEALVARAKASREAKGLKATYVGVDGKPFDMFHPTQAHKDFYDFKYELRGKYPTEREVPKADMKKLRRLCDVMKGM